MIFRSFHRTKKCTNKIVCLLAAKLLPELLSAQNVRQQHILLLWLTISIIIWCWQDCYAFKCYLIGLTSSCGPAYQAEHWALHTGNQNSQRAGGSDGRLSFFLLPASGFMETHKALWWVNFFLSHDAVFPAVRKHIETLRKTQYVCTMNTDTTHIHIYRNSMTTYHLYGALNKPCKRTKINRPPFLFISSSAHSLAICRNSLLAQLEALLSQHRWVAICKPATEYSAGLKSSRSHFSYKMLHNLLANNHHFYTECKAFFWQVHNQTFKSPSG